MTDQEKLQDEIARGHEAERIINNPLVQEAFRKIETRIENAWKDPRNGPEQREDAYKMYRLFEDFKHKFHYAMASGEAAQLKFDFENEKETTT